MSLFLSPKTQTLTNSVFLFKTPIHTEYVIEFRTTRKCFYVQYIQYCIVVFNYHYLLMGQKLYMNVACKVCITVALMSHLGGTYVFLHSRIFLAAQRKEHLPFLQTIASKSSLMNSTHQCCYENPFAVSAPWHCRLVHFWWAPGASYFNYTIRIPTYSLNSLGKYTLNALLIR